MLVMATILRLPYTMAIAPYFRGGLLYGLSYRYAVSASTRVFQCAQSAPHPPVPGAPRGPALCTHDPCRGGHHAQRAALSADRRASTGADCGPHADDGAVYRRLPHGRPGVWAGLIDDEYQTGAADRVL